MVWIIIKPPQKKINKDTRWDRIRKKYSQNRSLNSAVVRKLVEKDFIGKSNRKLLNGEVDAIQQLNPALVMDIRHQIFQKSRSNKLKDNVPKKQYRANIDKCILHNVQVEEHYILNQLSKFRDQLAKSRERCTIKPKRQIENNLKINNDKILKSLENTTKHIEDFYTAPLQAIEYIIETSKPMNRSNITAERGLEDLSCDPEVLSMGDVISSTSFEEVISTTSIEEDNDSRCVRFEEQPRIIEYPREESFYSNTSTEIESTVSLLAEKALNEIQSEEDCDLAITDIRVEGSAIETSDRDPLIISQILPSIALEEINSSEISVSSNEEDSEDLESNEQTEIIQQLFQAKAHSNTAILWKYFMRWIHFTTIQKLERQNTSNKSGRIKKINAFLDYVRQEKKSQTATKDSAKPVTVSKVQMNHIAKKYQSKIKIQQDIIDMQKMKLERQERMITELKLNKLTEGFKEDREEVKNELKQVIRKGDPSLRAKARCLQIMGNLNDKEDDEFTRLQGQAMIQPKFLANMHERALIHNVRHEQAKQRRLQKEAEREAAKMAMEEEKRLQDEEAKRMRIELLRERRRQEKLAKIMKERERQKAIENNKKSQQFCRKYLLRRVGMKGFKKLIERKRAIERSSEMLRKKIIKKNIFFVWKTYYLIVHSQKILLANKFHDKIVQRLALRAWVFYLNQQKSKYWVACDWYDLNLSQRSLTHWIGYTKLEKMMDAVRMKQASLHHEWHLKWKVVDRWQRLPHILKLEKETDERRQRWRLKIWELLPDYTPNRDQII